MLNSKKGIQSHILILLIVSITMALFLSVVLTQIYGDDNKLCKKITFEVTNPCRKGETASFFLNNNNAQPVEFKINGKRDILKYYVPANGKKEITVSIQDKHIIKIVPLVKQMGDIFECNGKLETINSEVLTKCRKN